MVNNCAAALLLTLAALARRKGVLVSRGELIEIGGEFRIPDIMGASAPSWSRSGRRTGRRRTDYRERDRTGTRMLLKVHPSNYRVVGFTAAPVPRRSSRRSPTPPGVPFVFDLGSGLLERLQRRPQGRAICDRGAGRRRRPRHASPATSSSVVRKPGSCWAGPTSSPSFATTRSRARCAWTRCRSPPSKPSWACTRAVDGRNCRSWRMLRESADAVHERARALARPRRRTRRSARGEDGGCAVGGGSIPGYALPSWGVAVRYPDPPAMAARLRSGTPSVFCRVEDGQRALRLPDGCGRAAPRSVARDPVRPGGRRPGDDEA